MSRASMSHVPLKPGHGLEHRASGVVAPIACEHAVWRKSIRKTVMKVHCLMLVLLIVQSQTRKCTYLAPYSLSLSLLDECRCSYLRYVLL